MKIAIGTAQMGLRYGAFNSMGRIVNDSVREILQLAERHGVRTLDTAYAYGKSEEVLGSNSDKIQNWQIVTKIPPLKDHNPAVISNYALQSLQNLKVSSVYGFMMHNAQDLLGPSAKQVWSEIQSLKDQGITQKIGVSVYTLEEAQAICSQFPVEILQIPLNLIDRRVLKAEILEKIKTSGTEIHARSIFLQGLLLADIHGLNSFFAPIKPHLESIRRKLIVSGVTPLEACVNFVKGLAIIDKMVVGIDSPDQLIEIINAYMSDKFIDQKNFEWTGSEIFLNPGHWKLAK